MTNTFLRVLYTEWLKTKSTVALKVAYLSPILVVLLYTALIVADNDKMAENNVDVWSWQVGAVWRFWSGLPLTFIIGVLTGLVNNIENANGGWKNIYTLPIERSVFDLAKLTISMLLILLNLVLTSVYTLLSVYALSLFFPDLNISNTERVNVLFWIPFSVFLGSLGIIAIHHFLSRVIPNLFVTLTISCFLTLSTLMAIYASDLSEFYPWCWPLLSSFTFKENGVFNSGVVLLSGLVFMICTSIMMAYVKRVRIVN